MNILLEQRLRKSIRRIINEEVDKEYVAPAQGFFYITEIFKHMKGMMKGLELQISKEDINWEVYENTMEGLRKKMDQLEKRVIARPNDHAPHQY